MTERQPTGEANAENRNKTAPINISRNKSNRTLFGRSHILFSLLSGWCHWFTAPLVENWLGNVNNTRPRSRSLTDCHWNCSHDRHYSYNSNLICMFAHNSTLTPSTLSSLSRGGVTVKQARGERSLKSTGKPNQSEESWTWFLPVGPCCWGWLSAALILKYLLKDATVVPSHKMSWLHLQWPQCALDTFTANTCSISKTLVLQPLRDFNLQFKKKKRVACHLKLSLGDDISAITQWWHFII